MMRMMFGVAALAALVGCSDKFGVRVPALEASAWDASVWISVKDAPVFTGKVQDGARAADGTSWFVSTITNAADVASVKWMTTALGVYEIYANGKRVGQPGTDVLKPGFTDVRKTRRSFTYDVTDMLATNVTEVNTFAAEVSAGWWRDKIVNFHGKKSAFRGVLEYTFKDGSKKLVGTDTTHWRAGIGGNVLHAAIFDGEIQDGRIENPYCGSPDFTAPEVNTEFKGEILPSEGGEICARLDKVFDLEERAELQPREIYVWEGVEGAASNVYGRVVRKWTLTDEELQARKKGLPNLAPGERMVIDFGQNCAAVPVLLVKAQAGTIVTVLPAEMLNDGNGEKSRGNDGPAGSVYRENLRVPHEGMSFVYTCKGGEYKDGKPEAAYPRFTFFGYRYLSITVSQPAELFVLSVPVTSIAEKMEIGSLVTGDKAVNRLIQNAYWGQLSNYLSVPTDCPQRNERLGWSADTQVFCEAGSYLADTRDFFRKWTRDLRDSRCSDGGYPSVAPYGQYGNETFNVGWADVGVVVPYTIWRQFGDRQILEENFAAMSKYVRKLDETKYDFEGKIGYIYADWLSFETFETCGNSLGGWGKWKNDPDAMNYRRYLAASYWLYDARLMVEMSEALGKKEEAAFFRASAARALAYIREKFVESDGLLLKPMRHLQTACVFALKLGILEPSAAAATKGILLKSIADHDGCLQTGFLGTAWICDALTQAGETQAAYSLLLNHKHPGWLYSVDQGATTVWERWNSYTKEKGFGPVGMNSFNHYAYGCVVAWIFRVAAGIAPLEPGYTKIRLAPQPDRRLGSIDATYKSAAGTIKSAWRYEGEKWIWNFTIPERTTAEVLLPNAKKPTVYTAGTYEVAQ